MTIELSLLMAFTRLRLSHWNSMRVLAQTAQLNVIGANFLAIIEKLQTIQITKHVATIRSRCVLHSPSGQRHQFECSKAGPAWRSLY